MPEGKSRSLLRRSGPVGALGFVCLACLVPVSSAASSPAPDPPPLAVTPDPEPAQPVVVAPRRLREAPAVVQAPAVQSSPPAATSNPPALADEPAVAKNPARRVAPRPVKKRPAAKKAAPVTRPAKVVTSAGSTARDVWQAPRAAVSVPQVEVLQRRRFALAGVALALVALSGGVLLGVGRQSLLAAVE
jgi:hypothetical protein